LADKSPFSDRACKTTGAKDSTGGESRMGMVKSFKKSAMNGMNHTAKNGRNLSGLVRKSSDEFAEGPGICLL
jgi:hypothetical protein